MLSDQQLLRRLTKLCRAARQIDVGVILLLIQVEDRRLHLEAACSSLHDFCRRKLRWSEGTTQRRIEASRVARRCPAILEHLKSGAITLSALAQVRTYIDATNVEEWVRVVSGKSRRQIELLLADLTPKPDVLSLIRPLPRPRASSAEAAPVDAASVGMTDAAGTTAEGRVADVTGFADPATKASAAFAGHAEAATDGAAAPSPGPAAGGTDAFGVAPSGDLVAAALAGGLAVSARTARTVRVEPLGDARWKIQLMARQALHDKVERAQALMRHRNPSGDLAVVFEAALDALLEHLERPRRAPVSRSRRRTPTVQSPDAPTTFPDAQASASANAPPSSSSGAAGRVTTSRSAGAVSLATRRAVFARDGERCTFMSEDGHRCPATERLEVDHIHARGLGGSGELPNLRLRCRAHNKLHAEQTFGRAHVEQRIQERKHARNTSTVEVRSRPEEPRDRPSPPPRSDRTHRRPADWRRRPARPLTSPRASDDDPRTR